MIAAYKALFKRHALVLCATASVALLAWFTANRLVQRLVERSLNKTLQLSDLTVLKWKLFMALAFILAALFYMAWKTLRYHSSTVLRLRKAIRTDKLDVHYQPIVDLRKGHLVGAESHSRWRSKGVAVPANAFTAPFGNSGLTNELTRSVIRRVAEDYSTYLWACKDFYITVNLSAQDLLDETFADFVASIIATYNIPTSAIVFEIAESALLDHKGAATQFQKLRSAGHRIDIGTFGTDNSRRSFIEPALPVHALARRYFQCSENINSEWV
ncbi:EAL domain-containing protein [Pseudomonas baetica]|uniref:EAL domain-containing protein n=1 Tax=Pseudomonas baetica TaxID=674054 RepID=UPI003EEA66A2